MKAAHHLYRSTGFKEIAACAGSEIPQEFQHNWVFMKIAIRPYEDQEVNSAG